MFELLEQWRQKPERKRKQIALLVSLSFTVVLLGVWYTVVYPDIRFSSKKEKEISEIKSSPLNSFFQTFENGAAAIGSQASELKEKVQEAYSSAPVYYSTTTSEVNQ